MVQRKCIESNILCFCASCRREHINEYTCDCSIVGSPRIYTGHSDGSLIPNAAGIIALRSGSWFVSLAVSNAFRTCASSGSPSGLTTRCLTVPNSAPAIILLSNFPPYVGSFPDSSSMSRTLRSMTSLSASRDRALSSSRSFLLSDCSGPFPETL